MQLLLLCGCKTQCKGDAVYMDLGKHTARNAAKQVSYCMPHRMMPSKHIKFPESCTITRERNRLKQFFVVRKLAGERRSTPHVS